MPAEGKTNRAVGRARRSGEGGQGLVELALTLPIFIALVMGLIEFSFVYNAVLTVQYAARQGVSAAAQAGALDGADCVILHAVEAALTPPIDRRRVAYVDVFLSDANGNVVSGAVNHYVRSGSLDCPGTDTEPYSLSGSEGYPQVEREDTLAGGLDVVGVRIGYTYQNLTPVAVGQTWNLSDGATLRIEPKQ